MSFNLYQLPSVFGFFLLIGGISGDAFALQGTVRYNV